MELSRGLNKKIARRSSKFSVAKENDNTRQGETKCGQMSRMVMVQRQGGKLQNRVSNQERPRRTQGTGGCARCTKNSIPAGSDPIIPSLSHSTLAPEHGRFLNNQTFLNMHYASILSNPAELIRALSALALQI